jgi:hypothetical protein
MFDFDLKHTNWIDIYIPWLESLADKRDDILKKICIEQTLNNG